MGLPRVGIYEEEMKGRNIQNHVLSNSQCRLESGLRSGRLAGEKLSTGTLASGLVSVGADLVRRANAQSFGGGAGDVAAGRAA